MIKKIAEFSILRFFYAEVIGDAKYYEFLGIRSCLSTAYLQFIISVSIASGNGVITGKIVVKWH